MNYILKWTAYGLTKIIAFLILAIPGVAWSYNADLLVPPISSSGNYAANWTVHAEAAMGEMEHLQQSFNGGGYTNVYSGFSGFKTFLGKPEGTYAYRVKWDICFFSCTYLYTPSESIVVDYSLTPDSFSDQLSYEYEIRSGDFDNNGFVDVLVDRITTGNIDGSMQTVIIEGSGSGTSVIVPTPAELNAARAHPIDPNIKPGGSDENFDGFADIVLSGLSELLSPSYPYDCLILYASGVEGIAQPLGHIFMDDGYMELFDNVARAIADPGFFAANQNVTIRPVFGLVTDCSFHFSPFTSTALWDCDYRITITDFDVQIVGIGYHVAAPNVTDAIEDVTSGDQSNGDPWWRLSQLMKGELGVNSFGYQPDGSRLPTNYGSDSDSEDEFGDILNAYMHRLLTWVSIDSDTPENWDSHVYDVDTSICSTTGDTVYNDGLLVPMAPPSILTIPQSICTLSNVFCWAKKRPAPRADNEDISTVLNGQTNVLTGGNPIRTHVFTAERVLVNETLDGHILHDVLQQDNCGQFSDIDDINNNSSRCSYVHRKVSMIGSNIHVATHGEGRNPTPLDMLNEFFGGEVIFPGVDAWIRRRLAMDGACTDDP